MTQIENPVILGIMSGTSLDGIDLAACKFSNHHGKYSFEIMHAETIPYTHEDAGNLKNAFNLSGDKLIELHHQYGKLLGQKAKYFAQKYNLTIDYIASHGHTIFHQPNKEFTFQLGHGASIAAHAGISTICDFRTSDVAYGGQGAPLVPIGDQLLFHDFDYCLNLGGISNISYQENNQRCAFDIGICNMALNNLANQINLHFDNEGALAKSGSVDETLLQALLMNANMHHKNHQSLSFEWYQENTLHILEKNNITIANKLRTCCEFIALQIAQITKHNKSILITGGGAKNTFLVQCIQRNTKANIIIPDNSIVDFKEALIFAFLGYLRLMEKENVLTNVTGAKKAATAGAIYLP
jgi:anhydro-N-acetylmuramic acid kinase